MIDAVVTDEHLGFTSRAMVGSHSFPLEQVLLYIYGGQYSTIPHFARSFYHVIYCVLPEMNVPASGKATIE